MPRAPFPLFVVRLMIRPDATCATAVEFRFPLRASICSYYASFLCVGSLTPFRIGETVPMRFHAGYGVYEAVL